MIISANSYGTNGPFVRAFDVAEVCLPATGVGARKRGPAEPQTPATNKYITTHRIEPVVLADSTQSPRMTRSVTTTQTR